MYSFRRLFSIRRRQAEALSAKAEDQLERNLVRKFGRLVFVRRFVAVWVLLILVLIGSVIVQARALSGYYQTLQPVPGGIYNEGIVGGYTNSNPLYAAGQANDAVSKLLFASLFKYDTNNRLVGDLASRYDVDETGTKYTIQLRSGLTWHDGQPLTASDVLFTYKSIQNPDVQSPLNVSWQNVSVSSSGPQTITFQLPNPLSSFPYSLVNGIIPEHAFKGVKPVNFRSVSFNTTKPIGAGPFRLQTIEVQGDSPNTREEEIQLVPFENYHEGVPKISSFVVHTYPNQERMLASFHDRTITAMVGLQQLPKSLAQEDSVQESVMPLTAANMVFFKTTSNILNDQAVRQALVGAIDVGKVIQTSDLEKPVLPVKSPVLQSTPGYDPTYQQLHFPIEEAAARLDKAGWLMGPNGTRTKNNQPLTFKLYAQNTPEYSAVTQSLKKQWQQIGVTVQVFLQADADLRSTVSSHSYDALLYGISLGIDPDEYVYWHSSQADVRSASRLNLSEYKSSVADSALEDGRTRNDPILRAIKYRPFLQAWQQDAPALGLYQPHFLYVTRGEVYNFADHTLTTDTDRFNNVQNWMIREAPQTIGR
jgi:peptide/nickel transport system substrate-binding protein